jgi:glycosyltransferase involved in cell wall biosynthesis
MRVCVATEQRFASTPDHKVWAPAGPAYEFLSRYLEVFDSLRVVARIAQVVAAEPTWKRADGPGVDFAQAPYYVGAAAYLRKYFKVRTAVRRAVNEADAVVLRGASALSFCLESSFANERPFGLEVIGDPYDVFAPGSVQHPLRPILRWWLTRNLKRECQRATAIAYVTHASLQKRYPAGKGSFETSYSSVELSEQAFVNTPRQFGPGLDPVKVVTVGSLEQMYKGFDVLIDALALCRQKGIRAELVIIGEGRCRPELEQHVRDRGLGKEVRFTGQLQARSRLVELLDSAGLFVLPSKTEGLPRAMIEAMARALPCIGTAVGGIPELLPPADLVPRGDAAALAQKMIEVVREPGRMAKMAATNLQTARGYCDSVLRPKRREFLEHVRRATLDWKSGLKKTRLPEPSNYWKRVRTTNTRDA